MCTISCKVDEDVKNNAEAIFESLGITMSAAINMFVPKVKSYTVDEAFAKYKEGMEKLKVCKESIDRVETQIRILSEGEAEG